MLVDRVDEMKVREDLTALRALMGEASISGNVRSVAEWCALLRCAEIVEWSCARSALTRGRKGTRLIDRSAAVEWKRTAWRPMKTCWWKDFTGE